MGISYEKSETIPIFSSLASESVGWFVYDPHLSKPGSPHVYLVQEFVLDLALPPVMADFVSFLPRGIHGFVASLLESDHHSPMDDLVPLLVLLQMTSGDPLLEPQRTEYT